MMLERSAPIWRIVSSPMGEDAAAGNAMLFRALNPTVEKV
jgi:hypothetical protein